jgi:hypothetical protein
VTTYSTLNGGTVDMASIDPTYNRPRFHIEESAKAGFTGVQETDRATAAGYAGSDVGELGAYTFNRKIPANSCHWLKLFSAFDLFSHLSK